MLLIFFAPQTTRVNLLYRKVFQLSTKLNIIKFFPLRTDETVFLVAYKLTAMATINSNSVRDSFPNWLFNNKLKIGVFTRRHSTPIDFRHFVFNMLL